MWDLSVSQNRYTYFSWWGRRRKAAGGGEEKGGGGVGGEKEMSLAATETETFHVVRWKKSSSRIFDLDII